VEIIELDIALLREFALEPTWNPLVYGVLKLGVHAIGIPLEGTLCHQSRDSERIVRKKAGRCADGRTRRVSEL